MMSPRQPKWKTKNTKKINHSKPVKPVLLGMNMVFLCPNREDGELKICTFPLNEQISCASSLEFGKEITEYGG
ncbi:hypothetical protein G5714_023617 [Onychostoma macrolepis]|uniref:Uncharacterized protein n=1 Tax=Onychostoma macrolepis TaxID=369639 RepID=A0A7J6BM24_9TELE|nr:hypothetical protein G5714_023617 [Onychostoma macrolepis]